MHVALAWTFFFSWGPRKPSPLFHVKSSLLPDSTRHLIQDIFEESLFLSFVRRAYWWQESFKQAEVIIFVFQTTTSFS